MKRIINVLLVAFVLSLVPATYICAQGHIETPAECLAKERAERKMKAGNNYTEGFARYQDDSGLYGYIDEVGDIIAPCQWKETWTFSDGMAAVKDNNDKWGYIDKTGNIIE